MMKNIVFSLALLGALTETGPAFAESKSLPDCAVTSAKSHGVELALFRALMIHELGETPLAAPCSFYEAAAANLATSLNSQHGGSAPMMAPVMVRNFNSMLGSPTRFSWNGYFLMVGRLSYFR